MPSLNAFKRAAVTALAVLACCTAAPARADDKQACSNAYDLTQRFRKIGRLQTARTEAAICVRDVCTEFIRVDCATWLREIDAGQPTVVFQVLDAEGHETSAVRVTLDGAPWLERLDGSAQKVDPGQHTFLYELDASHTSTQTLQIREGEKNRKLVASFQRTGDAPAPRESAAPAGGPSIAPWILGGAGLSLVAAGGVLGGVVLAKKSVADAHCSDVTKTCDPDGESASKAGRTLGPLSTVGFAVGGAAVTAAVLWLALRSPPESAVPRSALRVSPLAGKSAAGVIAEGSF